jgi:hypothetical protein
MHYSIWTVIMELTRINKVYTIQTRIIKSNLCAEPRIKIKKDPALNFFVNV